MKKYEPSCSLTEQHASKSESILRHAVKEVGHRKRGLTGVLTERMAAAAG